MENDIQHVPRDIYRDARGVAMLFRIASACLLLMAIFAKAAHAQQVPDEYKVKAAFVFHFAQLIQWPITGGSSTPSIDVCAFSDEPWLPELQSVLDGKTAANRTIHVRVLTQSQNPEGCDVLFLGRSQVRRQLELLRALHGSPTLTVGETDSFLPEGGIIRFRLNEDRVRFDINLAGAESCHLKISSRLLLLATNVTRTSPER